MRDPDGGINLLRKRAQAGTLSESGPKDQDIKAFPKDGYTVDLSKTPKISFGTVWRFMIESVTCKKQIATAKPLVKGYNFFMSNHVLSMYHLAKDGKHFIKSKVLPSMKKSAVYTCYISISSLGFVIQAKCGCPAGMDGRCNHVTATLFGLESFHKKKKAIDKEDDISCTSKPCGWSVPPKRKGPVQPISAMKFKKHDYGKDKKIRQPMFDGKDVRAPHQQKWSDEKLKLMLNQLKELQDETGQPIGWCHLLPQVVPSVEVHQESEYGNSQNEEENNYPSEIISPIKACDSPMSLQGIKERCERIKKTLNVSSEEASKVESETREQSDSTLWYLHRKGRITASKSYRIAAMKNTTSPSKAIKECMYAQMKPTKYMLEGLAKEPEIMELYIQTQTKSGHIGIQVTRSGFVISKADGFLGASPDGLVNDPSVDDPDGLLEMKFIQTNKYESLEDALLQKRMCIKENGGIIINRRHQYFYQIQQAMYVTERKWNDFVVKGSTYTELYIERVKFDNAWWDSVKEKLETFFDNHICPELAYPRIKFGLPRFDLTT